MSKVAIIDLDGVIANNEARFAKAEKVKSRFRAGLESMFSFELENPVNQAQVRKGVDDLLENLFWQEAFNPANVILDTLIEGVPEALDQLQGDGYSVTLLTSRPESMRQATENWLANNKLMTRGLYAFEIIMKAPAFQYTKTTVWKAGMVQTLHRLYRADELLFIDDEEANRRAVLDAYPDGGEFGIVRVYDSLAEAVAMVEKEKQ